jgi:hypothetical protein
MSVQGRPPKPTELKRAQGTLRADRLPGSVIPIQLTNGAPEASTSVTGQGLEFWSNAWRAGWLSPISDLTLATIVAEQITEREQLRAKVL